MSGLSAVQEQALVSLARGLKVPWVLTGGAALGGFHTRHRTTRDLDITPLDRLRLGDLPESVRACLAADGLDVALHRLGREHCQLSVSDAHESIVVDIVAGWSPASEAPGRLLVRGESILVDTPHELLVRKLMALFDRSEPRDLEDIRALMHSGGDLGRAVDDAGRAFSGLTANALASCLETLPLVRLARVVGWDAGKTAEMDAYRLDLAQSLRLG